MPSELFLRGIDLDLLYPPFLERLLAAKAAAKARGALYLTTYGFRAVEESDELVRLFIAGKGGRAAPGGKSSHNYGLATDEALIVKPSPGRVIRWDPADYKILIEETEKRGLHNGRGYKDFPHFSWPKFINGKDLEPLLKIWQAAPAGLNTLARLQLVWAYVDVHSPAMPPVNP